MTVLTLYRDDNHCVYLKSKEFNLTNGLRKVKEENTTSVVEPEFLFELLTGVKMPNVSTMEELRKIFKIKSMNRSKVQYVVFLYTLFYFYLIINSCCSGSGFQPGGSFFRG